MRGVTIVASVLSIAVGAFVSMGAAQAPGAAPAPAAGQGRGRGQPPQTPQAQAPIDLTGWWVSVVTEDWRWRMVTPAKGDYSSVPINNEGRRVGDTWDPAKDEREGNACKSYGVAALMRVPGRLHVTWQDDSTLKVETDAGTQTRLLHFGETPAPAGEQGWRDTQPRRGRFLAPRCAVAALAPGGEWRWRGGGAESRGRRGSARAALRIVEGHDNAYEGRLPSKKWRSLQRERCRHRVFRPSHRVERRSVVHGDDHGRRRQVSAAAVHYQHRLQERARRRQVASHTLHCAMILVVAGRAGRAGYGRWGQNALFSVP